MDQPQTDNQTRIRRNNKNKTKKSVSVFLKGIACAKLCPKKYLRMVFQLAAKQQQSKPGHIFFAKVLMEKKVNSSGKR